MTEARETLAERFERVAARQRETFVVSADDFRVDEFGVYNHEGDMGIIAYRMAERVFTELLPTADRVVALAGAPAAGKTTWIREHKKPGVLYLDLTLSRRRARREVCALANDAGKEISCLLLHPPVEVCLMRNRTRGRQVPEDQLRQAHHRLTVCPPGMDEGWSSIAVEGAQQEVDRGSLEGALDTAGRPL